MSAGTLEDTKSELARCIEEAVNDAYAAGREQGWSVGCAAGRTVARANTRLEAVLTVLDARGIDVPGYPSDRFVGVGSTQLKEWIRRAATANSFDDLLVEP